MTPLIAGGQTERPTEIIGRMSFHAELDITAAEMKDWAPQRIMALFRGIAQIQAAIKGSD